MHEAKRANARLLHLPEGALSGYIKTQIDDWTNVDWNALHDELRLTAKLAETLHIWVVLGSNHRLTPPHNPHNSLYIISDQGTLHTRYDKQWCSNSELGGWYTPGREPCTFEVDGFRFGCALCIEINFPELFAHYATLGVDCMLFSSYSDDPMFGIQAQGHAANHNYWISVSAPVNTSKTMPARFIGPSGHTVSTAPKEQSVLLVHPLDPNAHEWNIALNYARPWRAQARQGGIYRERRVNDPRSDQKTKLP